MTTAERPWSVDLRSAPRDTIIWVLFDSKDDDPYIRPMPRLVMIEEWANPSAPGWTLLRYRLIDYDAKIETEYVENFLAKAWRSTE